MVRYRRACAPGGAFFFTVTLRDRVADTLTRHVGSLRSAFEEVRRARPFVVDAIVVLPEHLHAIWTLPDGDADFSGRWRAIKSLFVRKLRAAGAPVRSNARGEADVWARRFWEHQLRDEADVARHIDYIHFNPVKHGWVECAAD